MNSNIAKYGHTHNNTTPNFPEFKVGDMVKTIGCQSQTGRVEKIHAELNPTIIVVMVDGQENYYQQHHLRGV